MKPRVQASERSRTIEIAQLSRLEGEGGVILRIADGQLRDVKLNIFEPPRFFEALLRGRHYDEVPDIVARICGICPVAYQMSAVHALETAFGVAVDPAVRLLRRLLYCGEWIESHALHIYLLHAPDFLGFESALAMVGPHSALVERGLRLKKIGNRILTVLGGRAIHPVSVCVGGFHRVPRPKELRELVPDLEWAAAAAEETVRWTMQLTFPNFHPPCNFVSLSGPAEYPMNEGRIVSSSGLDLPATDYDEVFLEHYVPHSTALHSLLAGQPYLVGPLARLNFNHDLLMPQARRLADSWQVTWPVSNPYMSIVARALELLHACEEALALVSTYEQPPEPKVRFQAVAGEGCAATEAPRGLLFHRYAVNAAGLVDFAKIVAPTSQNLPRIEEDLRLRIAPLAERPDSDIMAASQELVRCYDPCLSCSTHMMHFSVRRH